MSLVKRKINLTFELGKGRFGSEGFDTIKLEGLRVNVSVSKGSRPSFDEAQIQVNGMTLDQMNKISNLGKPLIYQRNNIVTVEAGDDESGLAMVFKGTINNCFTEFGSQPDVGLNIIAHSAQLEAMRPIAPTSYPGAVDVARMMNALAISMNKTFENNGVSVILYNQYLPGTAVQQMDKAAEAAHINAMIDGDTLAIWPKGKPRGEKVVELSPDTGLIGFPSYCDTGIIFRSLYNPNLVFNGQVNITNLLDPVNGLWIVNQLTLNLASETPQAPWFAEMKGYRFGESATVPR